MSNVTPFLLSANKMRDFFGLRYDTQARTQFVLENLDEYRPVASWETSGEGEVVAEEVFDLSNNPSRQEDRDYYWGNERSLSVGDLVEVRDTSGVKYFLCNSFGWSEVRLPRSL